MMFKRPNRFHRGPSFLSHLRIMLVLFLGVKLCFSLTEKAGGGQHVEGNFHFFAPQSTKAPQQQQSTAAPTHLSVLSAAPIASKHIFHSISSEPKPGSVELVSAGGVVIPGNEVYWFEDDDPSKEAAGVNQPPSSDNNSSYFTNSWHSLMFVIVAFFISAFMSAWAVSLLFFGCPKPPTNPRVDDTNKDLSDTEGAISIGFSGVNMQEQNDQEQAYKKSRCNGKGTRKECKWSKMLVTNRYAGCGYSSKFRNHLNSTKHKKTRPNSDFTDPECHNEQNLDNFSAMHSWGHSCASSDSLENDSLLGGMNHCHTISVCSSITDTCIPANCNFINVRNLLSSISKSVNRGVKRTVMISPNHFIGLLIDIDKATALPTIRGISEKSSLKEKVRIGDVIESVDGVDTKALKLAEVSNLLNAKRVGRCMELTLKSCSSSAPNDIISIAAAELLQLENVIYNMSSQTMSTDEGEKSLSSPENRVSVDKLGLPMTDEESLQGNGSSLISIQSRERTLCVPLPLPERGNRDLESGITSLPACPLPLEKEGLVDNPPPFKNEEESIQEDYFLPLGNQSIGGTKCSPLSIPERGNEDLESAISSLSSCLLPPENEGTVEKLAFPTNDESVRYDKFPLISNYSRVGSECSPVSMSDIVNEDLEFVIPSLPVCLTSKTNVAAKTKTIWRIGHVVKKSEMLENAEKTLDVYGPIQDFDSVGSIDTGLLEGRGEI
mmetsp:Transcript_57469/g.69142  ORF Transcript_57469/g.69142 Transcript_57469/m.69142 type:complete len:720 (-) Transcript_57469:318-2477(-)